MIEGFTSKQMKVLANATHRWNILYGATRSGKTHVSYYLALKHLFEHYNDPAFFVGKTINTLDRNVFDPMRELFPNRIGKIKDKREIDIFGKRCYCIGANDERAITKIQGTGVGYAYCDELTTFPENFFEMLKSRLDKPNACCDATCNPESPSHFVKQFIDKGGLDIYYEQFTIYDNYFLSPDFVTALENEYRGTIYFDKWILGKWVKAEGLVFPLFKREEHYLTERQLREKFGARYITQVIFGGDGANTNDATALVPLAIMDNGIAVTLEPFYHNPKINGQLSNEQLMPLIMRWLQDLERKYKFLEQGIPFYTAVDCASADLVLTLSFHLPSRYNVTKFTMKDIMQTTDTTNNAFAKGMVYIGNYGGYYNYYRNQFIECTDQLVTDLELMTWDKNNVKYDPTIPNDVADAFRYALCTWFYNPENLWIQPKLDNKYIKIIKGK